MDNGILVLHNPEGAMIIDFVDDLAAVFTAKYPEDLRDRDGKVKLEIVGLTLTDEKMKAVLMTNRKKKNTMKTSKPGVIIDAKLLNLKQYLEHAWPKAANATTAAAKMSPNVGQPKHCFSLE